MSINAEVRLVDESTGDLIQELGKATPYLSVNDEVELSEDGGPSTVYKVEKLRCVVAKRNHSAEVSSPKYSLEARVDIIVSVVP